MAKKEGRVQIAVPKDKEGYYSQIFYTIVYKDDPNDLLVYNLILNNPDLTAAEIQYKLKKEHQIQRSKQRIKNIAKRVGLPIKDII